MKYKVQTFFIYGIYFILLSHIYLYAQEDTYMPIEQAINEIDMHLQWDPIREIGIIQSGLLYISFRPNIPWVLVNFSQRVTITPLQYQNGVLMISTNTVNLLHDIQQMMDKYENIIEQNEYTTHEKSEVAPKKKNDVMSLDDNADIANGMINAIIIDPGHGGEDPGTIGVVNDKNIYEKDIVLPVAKQLQKLLNRRYADKDIILTRTYDEYISLKKRAEIANTLLDEHSKSNRSHVIFISIHGNASINPLARGFEIWYLPRDYNRTVINASEHSSDEKAIMSIVNQILEDEYSQESIYLASLISQELGLIIGNRSIDRGLKENTFYVVRNARMPAVLIELGFLTNKQELLLLQDPQYIKDLARGISNGIETFVNEFE